MNTETIWNKITAVFEPLWTDSSSLYQVILSFLIGAVIACFMVLYNKRGVGGFVRTLIKKGASTPESALTLAESGYGKAFFILGSLKNPDSGLRRAVSVVDREGKLSSKELTALRFYIPEEKRYHAETRYDGKHTSLPVLILAVTALSIVAYLCIKYIPELLVLLG